MIKKLIFEIEVDKAKRLIKEIKKHIQTDLTSVIIELECTQDKQDKTYDVTRFKVGYGGTKG